jgi:exoribonuclease R
MCACAPCSATARSSSTGAARLCLPDKIDVKSGRVEGHQDGFGFFIPDDKSGDMFIHEKEMRGVLHGDRVMVREHGVDRRGRKEGKIVEVLERVNQSLVGRLYRERGYQWVVAENRRISQDILIPDHADLGASNGQVVMTEIVEQPTKHAPPVGRVTKILGSYADPGMEIEIALRKHNLPNEFPPEVAAVAKKLPKTVLKKTWAMAAKTSAICRWSPSTAKTRAISTMPSIASRKAAATVCGSPSPMCRIMCSRARRSTRKPSIAAIRCISRAGSFRCCRKNSPTVCAR